MMSDLYGTFVCALQNRNITRIDFLKFPIIVGGFSRVPPQFNLMITKSAYQKGQDSYGRNFEQYQNVERVEEIHMTITAKVIEHSISEYDKEIKSVELRYPRFIHSEFMTHRALSKNSSSSRAIPVKRLIQNVLDDTAMPSFWGKNQPGMQAFEELNDKIKFWKNTEHYGSIPKMITREELWLEARDRAIEIAKLFDEAGYHKQIVNRLLEPFSHINVIVTGTEWSNFFALRKHEDAQPEIRILAEQIHEAFENSTPNLVKYGEWHLPYITKEEKEQYKNHNEENSNYDLLKLSVARCASVSYKTVDGNPMTMEKAVSIYDRLVTSKPVHASPTEHQATPDKKVGFGKWKEPKRHRNLIGWNQYRSYISEDTK